MECPSIFTHRVHRRECQFEGGGEKERKKSDVELCLASIKWRGRTGERERGERGWEGGVGRVGVVGARPW